MKYGLLAKNANYSFSAEIHKLLFGYDYQLNSLSEVEFHSVMKLKNFQAVNITAPYKKAVISYLDYIDPIAKSVGAVNTVVNRQGKLFGYNTDIGGLTALITKNGIELKDKKVLILGSGGTSETAMYVANQLGAKEIYKVSRSEKEGCITYFDAMSIHSNAEIIINTTPCGSAPNNNETPIDINDFSSLEALVDVVYNPLQTKLVCQSKQNKIKAVGGLYMLVYQAALAAELFVDKKVTSEKIEAIYNSIYKRKQNMVLIGMPGCGKTATARAIAKKSGKQHVDTDELIKNRFGKSSGDLIVEKGEQAFRDIESEIVKEIATLQNMVISTGGGAILREENLNLLRQNGKIYFLDRPLEQIKISPRRPLSKDKNALEKLYKERYDIYKNSADVIIIPTDGISLNADKILEDFNENSCN